MKVIITGGAGFIGSHLVDHYLGRGHEVVAVDNLITGRMENIRKHLKNQRFTFLKHDICKAFSIRGRIGLILHFASPASPFDYLRHPIETMRTAAFGTVNLLELARKKKARLLIASTSEVYGDPEVHPQKETYWGNVNPIGPRSVYDEGKRFAEAITMAYRRKFGISTCIVRIFNTYGERMRAGDGRAIPAFVNQALKGKPLTIFGNGLQTRSFCYITDMVNGIVKLAKIDYPKPVNIGNPREYTIKQVARTIKRLTGSRSPLKYLSLPEDDPRKRNPDISLARKLLKWHPEVGLETGLRRVIEWFKRNPEKA